MNYYVSKSAENFAYVTKNTVLHSEQQTLIAGMFQAALADVPWCDDMLIAKSKFRTQAAL